MIARPNGMAASIKSVTQSYRAFEMAASCTKMELVKKGAMVV